MTNPGLRYCFCYFSNSYRMTDQDWSFPRPLSPFPFSCTIRINTFLQEIPMGDAKANADIGLIGLAVMGENLALNYGRNWQNRIMRMYIPLLDIKKLSNYTKISRGYWRDARAVESGGLENRWARKGSEGSNPSLSEKLYCCQKVILPFYGSTKPEIEGFDSPSGKKWVPNTGEMTERPKVYDWKSYVPGRVPRVQIPLSPKNQTISVILSGFPPKYQASSCIFQVKKHRNIPSAKRRFLCHIHLSKRRGIKCMRCQNRSADTN